MRDASIWLMISFFWSLASRSHRIASRRPVLPLLAQAPRCRGPRRASVPPETSGGADIRWRVRSRNPALLEPTWKLIPFQRGATSRTAWHGPQSTCRHEGRRWRNGGMADMHLRPAMWARRDGLALWRRLIVTADERESITPAAGRHRIMPPSGSSALRQPAPSASSRRANPVMAKKQWKSGLARRGG